MSRDASNYLILVEKILGKTKEVTGDCQGELQAPRHRQLRALLRIDFGKAGWGIWGHKVLLGFSAGGWVRLGQQVQSSGAPVLSPGKSPSMVWAALKIPGIDFDPPKALPVSVQILQPFPALAWLCPWNCCSKAEQMENFLLLLVETLLWVYCRAGNLGLG